MMRTGSDTPQIPRSYGRVETESLIGLGHVKVVHQYWNEPIDISGRSDLHHLELTLLPTSRNAQARFTDYWSPHRFEPMGQLFFLPARQMVNARSDCRQQQSIVCNFDPAAVETWLDDKLRWTDDRLRAALDIANARIRNLLFNIGEEVRAPGFASGTMIELMAGQIAIELSRHLFGIEDETRASNITQRRMQLIEQRVVENCMPPTLLELAELCGISVRQLTRSFRVSRGRSIGNYIAEQRLNHAKRMLADGMSIKSVAFSTGFSAPSNFTAAFTRATGETPRQYRQRHSHKKPR